MNVRRTLFLFCSWPSQQREKWKEKKDTSKSTKRPPIPCLFFERYVRQSSFFFRSCAHKRYGPNLIKYQIYIPPIYSILALPTKTRMKVTQNACAAWKLSKNLDWEDFDIFRCPITSFGRLVNTRTHEHTNTRIVYIYVSTFKQNTHNRQTNAFRL